MVERAHPDIRPWKAHSVLLASLAGIALVGLAALDLAPRLLVWNATGSVPRGLYLRAGGTIRRGDFVLVWLPERARAIAHERGYLPRSVPALKPVAAAAGDVVCASEADISIDGTAVAQRRAKDSQGREMPLWSGCKTLSSDQFLLLSTYASDSFDGRYFGVSERADIIEKVRPVWIFR
jgi:conjugative transfer signal peptidase TraF